MVHLYDMFMSKLTRSFRTATCVAPFEVFLSTSGHFS